MGIEKNFWFVGREVETLYKLDLDKQVASLWGILNREVSQSLLLLILKEQKKQQGFIINPFHSENLGSLQ